LNNYFNGYHNQRELTPQKKGNLFKDGRAHKDARGRCELDQFFMPGEISEEHLFEAIAAIMVMFFNILALLHITGCRFTNSFKIF